MSVTMKPLLRELRAEAQRLGITPEIAGCSIEELIHMARKQEDPLGWLAIFGSPAARRLAEETEAPPPAEAVCDLSVDEQNEPAEIESDQVVDQQVEQPGPRFLPSATITVPQLDVDLSDCYVSRHVDVRVSRRQAEVLRRLALALDAKNMLLANGRRAVTAADAVRWLLEEVPRCTKTAKKV